jgi:hypothetical protein
METEDLPQYNDILEGEVTEESKQHLGAIGQWMQINAIVAFATLGLSLLTTVWTVVKIGGALFSGYGYFSAGFIVQQLVTITISLVLNILLLQTAGNIKKALQQNDQFYFNRGMAKMAAYFKVFGILFIIALVIVALLILYSVFARAIR